MRRTVVVTEVKPTGCLAKAIIRIKSKIVYQWYIISLLYVN